MGCYAPQIVVYKKYIQSMANSVHSYTHSFKIIQSELYYGKQTFDETMRSLLCYIHFDQNGNDYDVWMDECVQNDWFNWRNLNRRKTNSKTKAFVPSNKQKTLISD